MDLSTLQENFALPGVLAFSENEHGLVRAVITTSVCSAELYLQGAHLTRWQPTGHEPVLFLSERSEFAPGSAIRGGVPVIFPWFGARTGARTDGPSHGFARTSEWTLVFAALAGEDLHLAFTLGPSETSRALGYDGFQLVYELRLGRELDLRLTVANLGTQPLDFEEALHSYFSVGDVRRVSLTGLANTEYLDKTDHFVRKHQEESTLALTGETDRPYLNTEAPVELEDPVLQRRISVTKSNSKTTVIWNPWSELSARLADMEDDGWERLVCVETANAADNRIVLAPGERHTMQAHVVVKSS